MGRLRSPIGRAGTCGEEWAGSVGCSVVTRRSKRRHHGSTSHPLSRPPYFAIIDVETTGQPPKKDPVIELAVVGVDQCGNVVDEWSSRFTPEEPVGATSQLPSCSTSRDCPSPRTTHASISRSFARSSAAPAETFPGCRRAARWTAATNYMPNADRRRLWGRCWSTRIPLNDAHSALGDARASAGPLRQRGQARGSTGARDRIVDPEPDAILLKHLYPAVAAGSTPVTIESTTAPGEIRVRHRTATPSETAAGSRPNSCRHTGVR